MALQKKEAQADTPAFKSEILEEGLEFTDSDLPTLVWAEGSIKYPWSTSTRRSYEFWKGKAITGIVNGDLMQTQFGDFEIKNGTRGVDPGVIVFSNTGIGHVYRPGNKI